MPPSEPKDGRTVDSRLAVLEAVAHDARNSFKKQEIILSRLERLETLLGVLQQGTEALRDSVSEMSTLSMRRGMTLEGVLERVGEMRDRNREETTEHSSGLRGLRTEIESIRKELTALIAEAKREHSEEIERARTDAVDKDARNKAEDNRVRHNRLLWTVIGAGGTIIVALVGYIISGGV